MLLTDEEIREVRRTCLVSSEPMHYARAIEAKIMEKIGKPVVNWTIDSKTYPLYKLPEVKK